MAAVINKRDVALQAASPRTATVNLGTTVNVNGTLNGQPVADVVAAAFDSGTSNFFTSSTSDPTGGSSGDAHYNTTTQVMWFKIGSTWTKGGTVNASQIITGTLAAARIAANSITTDKIATGAVTANEIAAGAITATKLNVSTLSAITANLGTVNAGNINGSANIDIDGTAVFNGNNSSDATVWAGVFNDSKSSTNGVIGYAGASTGVGVRGTCSGSTLTSSRGVEGIATSGTGVIGSCTTGTGVKAQCSGSGVALAVIGNMTISTSSLVTNLNADFVDGKNASQLCQIVPTDSGTCTVSGNGFNLNCLISGIRTRGTSNFVYIENISDRRLKKDIKKEMLGLDFINQLMPVQYRLKSRPQTKHHGFIAQDLKDLIDGDDDSLFQTHEDGMHGVDYMGLIGPLVKAVQELSKQVEELKNGQKAASNS